jgi:hypothetical protein
MSEERARAILADFNDFPEMEQWKSYANNIAIYGEERKSGQIGGRTAGQIDSTRIFDTTFRDALEIFSAGIVSDLTPQSERWLELESQSFDPETIEAERKFYNAASDRIRTRIGQSNFYRAFHECVHSGGMFGTFCLAMLPSRKRAFNFTEIPFGKFRFREDEDGYATTVFHEWDEKTAEQISSYFQEDIDNGRAELPDQIIESLTSDSPTTRNKKFTIIHMVRPRIGAEGNIPAAPENRPFESVYVCKETNTVILDNDGLYYQPYIVTRILKSRHDGGFGRSPGTQSYPTVRVLNRAVRDISVAVEKGVRPPMLVPKDSSYRKDDRAGGEIMFDPHVPNGVPQPYVVPFDINSVDWFIRRLEGQIRSAFFNEMFKFFTQQDIATTEKTAFEVQMQAEEQLKLFTPIFQNIVDECLNQVIENVFIQMFLVGDFDDILEEEGLDEISNFSVVYNSRIALAVKAQRTQGLVRVAQAAQMIDAFVPGAGARSLDWERGLKEIAVNSTVPAEIVNDDAVIDQLKARDEQIMMLSQELEQLQMAGQAVSQLSSAGQGGA